MKKTTSLLAAAVLVSSAISAKPIKPNYAKLVAQNFYAQNVKNKNVNTLNLAYTGLTESGANAYYAFNINENDGFVIISADDAAQPVIG